MTLSACNEEWSVIICHCFVYLSPVVSQQHFDNPSMTLDACNAERSDTTISSFFPDDDDCSVPPEV